MRTKENRQHDTVTVSDMVPYVVLATIQLGGSAKERAIGDTAKPLVLGKFSSTFSESDRTPMGWGSKGRGEGVGEIEAPAGYQRKTWEAWEGKLSTAIMQAIKQGYLRRTYQDGIIEVTPKGVELCRHLDIAK